MILFCYSTQQVPEKSDGILSLCRCRKQRRHQENNRIPSWASHFLCSFKMGCCSDSSQDKVMTKEEYSWAGFLNWVSAGSWLCGLCSNLSGASSISTLLFAPRGLLKSTETATHEVALHPLFSDRCFPWKLKGLVGMEIQQREYTFFTSFTLLRRAAAFWLKSVWRMGLFA